MAKPRQMSKLPRSLGNPVLVNMLVAELREHEENVAKRAAEQGRTATEKPRIDMIRAFIIELGTIAEGRLGNLLDG